MKKSLMSLSIAVFVLFSVFSTNAQSGEYLGEFCWDVSIDLFGGMTGEARLGITHMGEAHYSVSGIGSLKNETFENSGPVTGSVELVGESFNMLLNFVVTTYPTIPYASQNAMLINLDANLNGTVSGVTIGNGSVLGFSDIQSFQGTVTYKPCP